MQRIGDQLDVLVQAFKFPLKEVAVTELRNTRADFMGAESLCLCIPAQSFYVPVVPSGIIYNSRQFYNSPFSAIYIDHRGCQSQARNTDFSRVPLSFLLSAVVLIA